MTFLSIVAGTKVVNEIVTWSMLSVGRVSMVEPRHLEEEEFFKF